jgi:hypothetical protein
VERLLEVLDSTQDEDRVAKAEALRELGRFDQAEALLLQPFPETLQAAIQSVLDLTRGRIRELWGVVHELRKMNGGKGHSVARSETGHSRVMKG